MRVLKTMISVAAIGLLSVVPAFAQATPPPQTPPAGQKPTTPTTPAEQKPAPPQPPAQPPKPFPEGAKVGYIDIQMIASNSGEGKVAAEKIKAWDAAKTKELQAKNKQAQDVQTKLSQSGTVLSESARSQSEKELQKLQRELQAMQEDAQQERQDLTDEAPGGVPGQAQSGHRSGRQREEPAHGLQRSRFSDRVGPHGS